MIKQYINDLKNSELSKNTIKRYETDLNQFCEYVKTSSLDEIEKHALIEYKNYLISKFKTNTVNIKLISLNKFLENKGRGELKIKLVKQQRKTTLENVLSVSDYKRLLRMALKLEKTKMYYLMMTLANTGIRISELKYITVEALSKSFVLVNNKNKERTIIIPKKLNKELKKYCKDSNISSGIIFRGRTNDLIDKAYVYKELQYVAGQARVKKSKAHAHSFRHLFAKEFLNENDDITLLADLLGHSSLETTRIYTKRSIKEQKDILNKLSLLG